MELHRQSIGTIRDDHDIGANGSSVTPMTEAAHALSAWQNFYVIVGSCAGALIGLQFVVIVLITNTRRHITADSVGAFGTPNVVHLAVALIVSAIMCAPWPSLTNVTYVLTACGMGGLAYGATVIRGARRQTAYTPDLEDWIWYAILPCSLYATLSLTAVTAPRNAQFALFVVGASALGLLLIGIRNAWDTVTHIIVTSHAGNTSQKTKAEEKE